MGKERRSIGISELFLSVLLFLFPGIGSLEDFWFGTIKGGGITYMFG